MQLHRYRRFLPGGLLLLLFAATCAGNGPELHNIARTALRQADSWNGRSYAGNGEHTDAPRELVETELPPGAALFYCCSAEKKPMQPADRSVQITLAWAAAPRPVRYGTPAEIGDADAVLISRYLPIDLPGFYLTAETRHNQLWLRADRPPANAPDAPARAVMPDSGHEMLGVFCVWILLTLLLFAAPSPERRRLRSTLCGNRETLLPAMLSAAFFAIASTAALTHTLTAPNGLGVYGGKARLFLLGGGLPEGFFTESAYATQQPAYPPGLAVLTGIAYRIAGGCGEWLTQLIPVYAMTAVLGVLLLSASRRTGSALWIFSAFCTGPVLRMSLYYYAEPFMALLLLLGWLHVRKPSGPVLPGWLLAGAAGLFKNEGLLFLLLLWLSVRILSGSRRAPLAALPLAAAAPCLWHIGARLAGATLYDYAAIPQLNLPHVLSALRSTAELTLLQPWSYGFVFPLALVALITAAVPELRRRLLPGGVLPRPLGIALLFAAACIPAFACIYGLSTSPWFDWHVRTSLPRLLWTPALLLHCELLCTFFRSPVPGPDAGAPSANRNTTHPEPGMCAGTRPDSAK